MFLVVSVTRFVNKRLLFRKHYEKVNIWLIGEVKYRVMKQRTCYYDKFHNFTLQSFKVEQIIFHIFNSCKEVQRTLQEACQSMFISPISVFEQITMS